MPEGARVAALEDMRKPVRERTEYRVVVGRGLSRQEAEALRLELRYLAKRFGLELRDFRVEPRSAKPSA